MKFIALFLLLASTLFGARENPEALRKFIESAKKDTVVVFDLDDTLFDASYRTWALIQDFLKQEDKEKEYPEQFKKIRNDLHPWHMTYASAGAMLANIGMGARDEKEKALVKELDEYWNRNFFSNKAVLQDQLNRGARDLVEGLHNTGVHIIYLTGRDEARMGEGTRKAIAVAGLPLDKTAELMLKSDEKEEDVKFKSEACEKIKKLNKKVIGLFDNEPRNIMALKDAFPDAAAFFLNTYYGGREMDKLVKRTEIFWIPDFIPTLTLDRKPRLRDPKAPTGP